MTRRSSKVASNVAVLVKPLLALIEKQAVDALKESTWYRSAPDEFKTQEPTVTFIDVRNFKVFYSMGLMLSDCECMEPFAVFETALGPHTATFRIKFSVGSSLVFMDEV